jgi:hypothetical protein
VGSATSSLMGEPEDYRTRGTRRSPVLTEAGLNLELRELQQLLAMVISVSDAQMVAISQGRKCREERCAGILPRARS